MPKKFSHTTLYLITILSLSFITKTPISYAANDPINQISDLALRAAINNKINQDTNSNRTNEKTVNLSDLESLHGTLNTSYANINQISDTYVKNLTGLEKAKNLTELNISGNNIQTLPENIDNLQNLKKLIASHNAIKTLPNNIGNLQKLKNLATGSESLELQPLLNTSMASETTATGVGLAETGLELTTIGTETIEGVGILSTIGESAQIGAEAGSVAEPLLGTAIGAGIGTIIGISIIIYTHPEYIKEKTKNVWHDLADTWHSWFG